MDTNASTKKNNSLPSVLSMDLDLSSESMENDSDPNEDENNESSDLSVRKTNASQMTSLQMSALTAIERTLKYRMKQAERRSVPNANAQVISYNSQIVQEIIPDHNDPYKVEWTDADGNGERAEYFIGEQVR
jgi:hypothetical protein